MAVSVTNLSLRHPATMENRIAPKDSLLLKGSPNPLHHQRLSESTMEKPGDRTVPPTNGATGTDGLVKESWPNGSAQHKRLRLDMLNKSTFATIDAFAVQGHSQQIPSNE
jgi:hypothetical protein